MAQQPIPYVYGYTTWVYTYIWYVRMLRTYVPYAYGENTHMV